MTTKSNTQHKATHKISCGNSIGLWNITITSPNSSNLAASTVKRLATHPKQCLELPFTIALTEQTYSQFTVEMSCTVSELMQLVEGLDKDSWYDSELFKRVLDDEKFTGGVL